MLSVYQLKSRRSLPGHLPLVERQPDDIQDRPPKSSKDFVSFEEGISVLFGLSIAELGVLLLTTDEQIGSGGTATRHSLQKFFLRSVHVGAPTGSHRLPTLVLLSPSMFGAQGVPATQDDAVRQRRVLMPDARGILESVTIAPWSKVEHLSIRNEAMRHEASVTLSAVSCNQRFRTAMASGLGCN